MEDDDREECSYKDKQVAYGDTKQKSLLELFQMLIVHLIFEIGGIIISTLQEFTCGFCLLIHIEITVS